MTREFSKTVAIKATDDDERIATGLVLRANELDRQLDFLDGNGVRALFNDDPDDGVMHAVHPEGHATLERNEVLDNAETIDGHEFGADDWVIRRRYEDDARWKLVKDGVLSAYSIGGEVTEVAEFDGVDALPDGVAVPAQVSPDAVDEKFQPPTQIIDGSVSEISDVDVGAVASANHAVVKSLGALGKNVLDESGREEFVALMTERGASESGAESLYDYMTDIEKSHGMSTDTDGTVGAGAESDAEAATRWRRMKAFVGLESGGGESQTDTNTDTNKDTMTDDSGDSEDGEKSLPEENAAQLDSMNEKLDAALDAIGKADGDADGAEDGDGEKSLPEENSAAIEEMSEKVDDVTEKLDQVVEQGGAGESQQAGKAGGDEQTAAKAAIETEKEVFTR